MSASSFIQSPKSSPFSSPPHLHFFHRSQQVRHKILPPRPQRPFSTLNTLRSKFFLLYCEQNSNPNPDLRAHARTGGSLGRLGINADDLLGEREFQSPVELCSTRTLPPALTLRHGVEKLSDEIGKLKLNPPRSSSGVFRVQVAVPPSVKALDWFCCQQKSLSVFPQFYFSGEQLREHSDALSLDNGVCGASGAGAAVYFHSSSLKGCNLIARYLSIDSPLIRAYGFVGISYNMTSSLMEKQPGSLYFFMPQIELNEYKSCTFLASTLVWDNSLAYSFMEAVESLENCLHQLNYIPPIKLNFEDFWRYHILAGSELNGNDMQMVCLDAGRFAQVDARSQCIQVEDLPAFQQFQFRHSMNISFGANMLASPQRIKCQINDLANINLVWASLIVEECVRLGLTYFCIAPGSRSSPLAISACGHSLTTCISCIDERSLAFHAVGYGRGSHRAAVVITSSGTAVSNLFPAVVEASYDFVPLMLLTADRPPELLDAGANQAIDQVNHFGKFLRFFYNLPPPTDQISARMVLTTIDSAAYRAMQVPFGPVHINCPFREPLEDYPKKWSLNCLSGLDLWMSNTKPFTKYINLHSATGLYDYGGDLKDVLQVMRHADKGLLLIGAIHTEDEIWAALLLTKHLFWPVVTDVLSGIRLRRILAAFPEIEEHFLFLDYLDHVFLSDSVKSWLQPDVVVQIGSKITSKRISQFLEFCSPHSYILVDKHPCRHDPYHIVTHRVQSNVTEFADVLLKLQFPRKVSRQSIFLKALNMMVAMEISFLIRSESSLTEPHVAHLIGEAFLGEVALFLGNSMVVRDVDMYASGWVASSTEDIDFIPNCRMHLHGIRVAGNRGASGIDGLLSTAIGFAAGSGKKVLCVIGDVSFLHDTNGLAILNQRARREPITILVINNHGGAIFSLLPIADRTPFPILNQYFYTSHDVSIRKLCSAHSVKHKLVRTKSELQHALWRSQKDQDDCVIEVESDIADNAKFHRTISKFVCQAADQTLHVLTKLQFSGKIDEDQLFCKIQEMNYTLYRIELCAPSTSSHFKNETNSYHREGFILAITLDDGSVGFGEIAPIEVHKEDLSDAEEQLKFLLHVMEGSEVGYLLPLLKGSFSHWIWRIVGIPPRSVFPSVRCGMEMALLNALAARHATSLSDLITGCSNSFRDKGTVTGSVSLKSSVGIQICALVDCNGGPKEVAYIASQLVNEGFTTMKLKVARQRNPDEDASVIQAIRQMVGYQINIRADANRKWTYEQAVQFGLAVKDYGLQYIEEPVCFEDDIIRFCKEIGLPVALDETIDFLEGDALNKLNEFIHPGIVAVVIKPSVVGGFENASLIAKWAQLHGKMAVISSAFESSLSLASYVEFAHHIEEQNKLVCRMQNREFRTATAHGLGTYRWLKEDVTMNSLNICVPPHGGAMEASLRDADNLLRYFQINHAITQRTFKGEDVRSYQLTVHDLELPHSFRLLEAGSKEDSKVTVFLHGFLGTSEDWIPIMKALSATTRSISIDLPGHGHTVAYWHTDEKSNQRSRTSLELVADILMKMICTLTTGRVTVVGYSMGARIALYMAMKYSEKIDGAVIISGTPGLRNESTRRIRSAQDDARACYLLAQGLECFLETWYAGKLWKSLRSHPHFKTIMANRAKHNDVHALAKALSDLSTGKQLPLWDDLKQCKKPLLLIVGDKDTKFKEIAQQMCTEILSTGSGDVDNQRRNICEMTVIPDSGHAVHLENPLALINVVSKFVSKLKL